MSETGTSNEGSRKKKDLLSKYPYKGVGPRCLKFVPGERQIEANKGSIGIIDISTLMDSSNIMTVPVVGNIVEYDKIPVEKGSAKKKSTTKSKENSKSSKEKTATTKRTTKKSNTRDAGEDRE